MLGHFRSSGLIYTNDNNNNKRQTEDDEYISEHTWTIFATNAVRMCNENIIKYNTVHKINVMPFMSNLNSRLNSATDTKPRVSSGTELCNARPKNLLTLYRNYCL